MSSKNQVVVYPNIEKIFKEQISGTMTFGELKRRCIELSKTLRLRRATFTIEYKAKYSLIYTVKLQGSFGIIKRRSVNLECERIYLNPEWSFDDRIRDHDKVITDVESQIKVLNLPLYHGVDISIMHNDPAQEGNEKALAVFHGSKH